MTLVENPKLFYQKLQLDKVYHDIKAKTFMCKHVPQRTRFLISWYVTDWSRPYQETPFIDFQEINSDQDYYYSALFLTFFKQKCQFDTYLIPICLILFIIDVINDSSATRVSLQKS